MAFDRPSLKQLIDRAHTDIDAHLSGTDARLRRAVLDVIARMHAGAVHGLYGYADQIMKRKFFVQSADRQTLERWGRDFSLLPKAAANATGVVTFTGTDTTLIPAGTLIQRTDGEQFATDVNANISGANINVAVTSVLKQSSANTLASSTLTLVSPIANIDTAVTVDVNGLTGGTDIETDDDYRDRLLDRFKLAPHGGTQNDYIVLAKKVAGVTRAWCYPLENGDGTVVVRFMMDNSYADGIPQAGDVITVQSYIDPLKPVVANLTIAAPTPKAINFTLSVTPDTQAVKDAVEASINDLFQRKAEPGGTIALTQIAEAISLAAGETDHSLASPNVDITSVSGEIPVVGVFTWL